MKDNKYQVRISGALVSVYTDNPGIKPRISFRKIVSPDFFRVWYSINDDFDLDSWNKLPIDQKMYLAKVASMIKLETKDLSIAIANMVADINDRLKLIEGAVLAGNMNVELVKEYIELVEKLIQCGTLNALSGRKMIGGIKRKYSHMLDESV